MLALMMQGKSNKAICRVLKLAEPTVKNHVAAILKALKVKNRTEAAMAVVEHGWDCGGLKNRNGYRRLRNSVGEVVLLQEPAQHGSQCPRPHRLVQQMITARARLAAVGGPCRR